MGEVKEKDIVDEQIPFSFLNLIDETEDESVICSTIDKSSKEESKKQSEFIKILDVWQEEKKSDQNAKIFICVAMSFIMVVQVFFIQSIIRNIAKGTYALDEWTFRFLIVGVFGEIVALFTIIVNHLFPSNGSKDFLAFISEFKKNEKNNN